MSELLTRTDPRVSSKIVILNEYEDVLLLQRSAEDSHRPFQYDFPGGEALPREDPLDCAVREAYEETGILLEGDDCMRIKTVTTPSSHGDFLNERHFYLYLLDDWRPDIILNPVEHVACSWSFYGDAYNRLQHPVQKEIVSWLFDLQDIVMPFEDTNTCIAV